MSAASFSFLAKPSMTVSAWFFSSSERWVRASRSRSRAVSGVIEPSASSDVQRSISRWLCVAEGPQRRRRRRVALGMALAEQSVPVAARSARKGASWRSQAAAQDGAAVEQGVGVRDDVVQRIQLGSGVGVAPDQFQVRPAAQVPGREGVHLVGQLGGGVVPVQERAVYSEQYVIAAVMY